MASATVPTSSSSSSISRRSPIARSANATSGDQSLPSLSRAREANARLLKLNRELARDNAQLQGQLRTAQMETHDANLTRDEALIELARVRQELESERQRMSTFCARTTQVIDESAQHLVYCAQILREHLDALQTESNYLVKDIKTQVAPASSPSTASQSTSTIRSVPAPASKAPASKAPSPPLRNRQRKSLRKGPIKLVTINDVSDEEKDMDKENSRNTM